MATPYRYALLSMLCALVAPGCASQECDFHSQCGAGYYCRSGRCGQECRMDFDCAPGEGCNAIGQCVVGFDGGPAPDAGAPDAAIADAGIADAGARDAGIVPAFDAGHDAGRDAGTEVDAGAAPIDAGSDAGVDAGPSGTGQYLDRCVRGADCASGRCVDDAGGSRMCSIAGATHRDCASEHVCDASGTCVPDDTGLTCGAASECELESIVPLCSRAGTLPIGAVCSIGRVCASGLCDTAGYCTRLCTDDGLCPSDMDCRPVPGFGLSLCRR